ncbi:hypothetical protein CTI12_AA207180 [Artemisia annua]|uniref:ATPase, F1/V1/A1 complex, alpha/beta subunit, Zinc knuckle CX2CX4HX4C n=1 Tax=Artemisia annua TaxID=35608 RepID=A0A2U1MT22_ARTAN|nr:hypothetical protein CTI12_AA207180 [Artemisia annua]
MTATICHKGMGNMGYARVLVEVSAEKSLKENIEIQYRDKENNVKGTKCVKVMYDWKPPVCEHCKVFGHDMLHCTIRPKTTDEIDKENNDKTKEVLGNQYGKNSEVRNEEGVQGRRVNNSYKSYTYRNAAPNKNVSMNQAQIKDGVRDTNMGYKKQEYRKKQKENGSDQNERGQSSNNVNKRQWKVNEKDMEALKRSANKYSVLNDVQDDDSQDLNVLKEREIIDQFLNKKLQPTPLELSKWTDDMKQYFKDKEEESKSSEMQKGKDVVIEEDVFEGTSGMAKVMNDVEFSRGVWDKIKSKAGIHGNSNTLGEIVLNLANENNGNNIVSVVKRLCFAACVYGIWIERNNRIFRDEEKEADEVVKFILDTVKLKLMCLKVKDSGAVKVIERTWDISCKKVAANECIK